MTETNKKRLYVNKNILPFRYLELLGIQEGIKPITPFSFLQFMEEAEQQVPDTSVIGAANFFNIQNALHVNAAG